MPLNKINLKRKKISDGIQSKVTYYQMHKKLLMVKLKQVIKKNTDYLKGNPWDKFLKVAISSD